MHCFVSPSNSTSCSFKVASYIVVLFVNRVVIAQISIIQNKTSGTEIVEYADITDSDEFDKLCEQINVRVASPIVNSKMKTITVDFELVDPKYKICFSHFRISLKRKYGNVTSANILFDYIFEKASYTFENVTCGSYKIVINPCFNTSFCTLIFIDYPTIVNMTSVDCSNTLSMSSTEDTTFYGLEKRVIIILTLCSIALLFIIGILTYRRNHLAANSRTETNIFIENGVTTYEDKKMNAEITQVYLLHYYNNIIGRKVELLKDFLSKCSYFNVTQIEDELHEIFTDQDAWLDKVLEQKESHENKTRKKIIIVDSVEVANMEAYENENRIFCEIKKKLARDWTRSLDYENLFVVYFNGCSTESNELKYLVKGDRYCIPEHIIDLCVNLICGCNSAASDIELKLRQLLVQHPIKDLNVMDIK